MWFGLELNEFSRVSLEAGECSSLLDLNNRRPLCLSLWINPVYGKEGYLRLNRTQLLISVDGVNDNPLIRNALDDGFFVLNKCHIVFFKKNEDSDLPYQHRSNLLNTPSYLLSEKIHMPDDSFFDCDDEDGDYLRDFIKNVVQTYHKRETYTSQQEINKEGKILLRQDCNVPKDIHFEAIEEQSSLYPNRNDLFWDLAYFSYFSEPITEKHWGSGAYHGYIERPASFNLGRGFVQVKELLLCSDIFEAPFEELLNIYEGFFLKEWLQFSFNLLTELGSGDVLLGEKRDENLEEKHTVLFTQERLTEINKLCLKCFGIPFLAKEYNYLPSSNLSQSTVVYFISNIQRTRVKIGITSNLKNRLATFQTANYERLEILGYTRNSTEAKLHKLFDEYHVNGEWFEFNTSIEKYIQVMCEHNIWDKTLDI